jgi:hypothetical protein
MRQPPIGRSLSADPTGMLAAPLRPAGTEFRWVSPSSREVESVGKMDPVRGNPRVIRRRIGPDTHEGASRRPQRDIYLHNHEGPSSLGSETEGREARFELVRSGHRLDLDDGRGSGEQGQILPAGHQLNFVFVPESLLLAFADHPQKVVVGRVQPSEPEHVTRQLAPVRDRVLDPVQSERDGGLSLGLGAQGILLRIRVRADLRGGPCCALIEVGQDSKVHRLFPRSAP